jgi:hypothetical protein
MVDARKAHEFDVIGVRRFLELRPGDMFRARIADVRPGSVTIRFEDGAVYTARSLVLPDARMGEDSVFLVRENDFEGRIVLEMVKLAPQTRQDNMLREALHHAGMPDAPENLTLGRRMLAAGIPVEMATLQNNALRRLMSDPLALFSASAREMGEILHALSRSAHRRAYYQIKPAAEIHVFKNNAETVVVITYNAASVGRVEATLRQERGRPIKVTVLCDRPQTLDLLESLAAAQKGINVKSEKNALITEPFTLLSPPPLTDITPKRFNFDMRV